MTRLRKNRTRPSQSDKYATSEDFCQVFAHSLDPLYVLSLLLTGDHELAERCFIAGLEECVQCNRVFSEWAHCWAKRIIVQNAIRALQPYPGHVNGSLSTTSMCNSRESVRLGDFELYGVLALGDFERFVFVMSVLERYSDRDCALLLGCSLQEVGEARIRALKGIEEFARTDPRRDVVTWRASRQVRTALNAQGD
jgi:hypothetical protein